jgi:hypothetical protein
MDFCLITFRTITPAQRGEQVLRRSGFACSLQRTPRWMEAKGCGYSVKVPRDKMEQCVRKLRESNVAFQKIYLRKEDGAVEEVAL